MRCGMGAMRVGVTRRFALTAGAQPSPSPSWLVFLIFLLACFFKHFLALAWYALTPLEILALWDGERRGIFLYQEKRL